MIDLPHINQSQIKDWRNCERCGRAYRPSGNYQKWCSDCSPHLRRQRGIKLSFADFRFAPKNCGRCQQEFIPKSGSHRWCSTCKLLVRAERAAVFYTRERRQRYRHASRYGLSRAALAAFWEKQDGHCPLCERPLTDRFVIDHDHVTGHVRGLLHSGCNLRLSGIEDDDFHRRALEYLR